jgi:hypothetical protein
MADFGGGSDAGDSLNTAPLNAETPQQQLLTSRSTLDQSPLWPLKSDIF